MQTFLTGLHRFYVQKVIIYFLCEGEKKQQHGVDSRGFEGY